MEEVLQQSWFVVGLMAAFVVGAVYWRRQHLPVTATRAAPAHPAPIVYRESPTIRVADSQRVDRTRKVVQLRVGQALDLLPNAAGMPPRFRITCRSIVDGSDLEAAQIMVEFSGAQLSCGPLVHETAFNEFVIPRASRDEHRSSVFYYYERGDSLEFMRMKLKSAQPSQDMIELDIMQMHAHWPKRFEAEG